MEDQIKQCISVFRTSNNNQNIQNASALMSQLIRQPFAINSLFNVYTTSTDQIDRQHTIIYLIKSIKFCWRFIEINSRNTIFDMLTNILIREQVWFLKNLIIDAIYIVVSSSDYYEPLLNFISNAAQTGSEEYFLIALLLAPIINQINDPISNFLISLLDRGFFIPGEMNQLHLEIKISSLHLLLFLSSKLKNYQQFNIKFPAYWASSIEILDYCKTDYQLLKRVTNYYTFALHHRMNLDPLLLLQKSMTFFTSEKNKFDMNALLLIFNIIENICHFYPEVVLKCGAFPPIIDLTISLSSFLYHPNDSLSLSYSDFFESIYSDLCKSNDILQVMWKVITTVSSNDHGKFYACCCLHATLRNFPSFFDDKLNAIGQLLCISLSERKKLLCEAAARTATVFIGLFERELDVSTEIIKAVLEACKSDTSSNMLLYLTDLLNITKDSEELFDNAFPFLMAVLTSGSLELRAASLSALSALACGSTVKINVHFISLFQVLFDLLQSPSGAFDQLKPMAIETVARAASVVTGSMFNENILSFISFCVSNLSNNDLQIALSCFNAVEIILQSNSTDYFIAIKPAIPMLCEIASRDVSALCKSSIASSIERNILSTEKDDKKLNQTDEPVSETNYPPESTRFDSSFDCDEDLDFDFDFGSSPQILVSATSLRILSYLVKDNPELCTLLVQHIIECCKMQSKSFSFACRAASAVAVGNLAEGIAMTRDPSFEVHLETMSFVLFTLIIDLKYNYSEEASLLSDCFIAASRIVEWHDYESLGKYLKPILDFSLNALNSITSEPSYDSNASKVAEDINSFLSMILSSAEDQAPILLNGFLSFYIEKLTCHPEYRFRSLAAHFFADIMYSSSHVLDNNFKINALTFSATLADQIGDRYAFVCLRVVAAKNEEFEFAKKIANDVYRICMSKIALPPSRSKRFFLMRDNAVSTMAIYALNIFNDNLNFDECIPPILNALPLSLDFNENENVMNFFIWAFNKDQNKKFLQMFLRVLVLLFANPPSVFSRFQINKILQFSLLKLLVQNMSLIENSNNFVFQVLEGDGQKASILNKYMNDAAEQQQQEQVND